MSRHFNSQNKFIYRFTYRTYANDFFSKVLKKEIAQIQIFVNCISDAGFLLPCLSCCKVKSNIEISFAFCTVFNSLSAPLELRLAE